MSRKYALVLCWSGLALGAVALGQSACWLDPLQSHPKKIFDPDSLLKVKNTDEVPRILGELKDHYVLSYQSKSSQQDDIRVIAYSPKARAIVAYTGCPDGNPEADEKYPGCERVEVMTFQEPEEKIQLTEYDLPGKKFPNLPVQKTVNPTSCIGCHGNPTQARFEPYNTWPGFFGSRSREGEDVILKGSPEDKAYEAFKKRIWAHPENYRRYTDLTWRLKISRTPENLTAEQIKDYKNIGQTPQRIQHSGSTEPGPELNIMLNEWNARHLVHELVSSPQYPKLRYALMSIPLGCNLKDAEKYPVKHPEKFTIDKFLPPSLAKANFAELEATMASKKKLNQQPIRDSLMKENPISDDGHYRIVGADPNGRSAPQLAALAYLWQALGNGYHRWNTTPRQPFNFNDGRSGTGNILRDIASYVAQCDPELKSYLSRDEDGIPIPSNSKTLDATCAELAAKGRATESEGPALARPENTRHVSDRAVAGKADHG